jgi:hemerythrin superfamily protein
MEHNSELKHRLDTAFFRIIELTQGEQRKDLQHMWRHARNMFDLMDQELVQCRRVQKYTTKYRDFEKQALEALDTIEQYLTFATLLT